MENNAQEMVSHLVVLYCSPCSASCSPPSCHCPLLLITVPSSPSLSPPPHHCPLLPITVPSSPSLSPPPHHCPLLPITVPSSPSLSPPPHHIMLSWQIVFSHYSQDIPSSPQSSQLKELLLSVSEVYRSRWSAKVQVPGSVGTTWYGPGIGPTLMNNVAWTASHPPGDKLKWKALCLLNM